MEALIEQISSNVPTDNDTYLGEDGLLRCKDCGEPRQTRITVPLKGERIVNCICSCRKKEFAARVRREELEEQDRKRRICFAESNMHQWTFENSDKSKPELEKIMQNYVQYFTAFKSHGKGLLLHGPVGTGKSYAAACVANALIDKNYKVLMTDFSTLVNRLQGMFDGKQKYIDSLNNYALLIIDDLGIERDTEYMQEMIFNIINARYKSGLPMIVTTNLSIEALKKPADIGRMRIYDRVLERCHPVEVAGNSKRREKIKQTFFDTKALLEK